MAFDWNNTPLWKLRLQHFAIVVLIVIVLGSLAQVMEKWNKEQNVRNLEREKQNIGIEASNTGSLLWSAYKDCKQIGISDLRKCTEHSGPLLQDITAPVLAKAALEQQINYSNSCNKHYSAQYCYDLLNRAFHISQSSKD